MNHNDLIEKMAALGKMLDAALIPEKYRYAITSPVVLKRIHLSLMEWKSPYWVVAGEKFRSRRLARTWVKENVGTIHMEILYHPPAPIEYVEIKGEI